MAESFDLTELAAAAARGDSDAQYRMAALLIQTEGEEERAVDLLRRAAASGHPSARYTLAILTVEGRYVKQAPERAVTLLETIAEKDYPPARQLLAVLLAQGYLASTGKTKAPDWTKALALTKTAAEKGDPLAARDLGMLLWYRQCDGAPWRGWLRRAAMGGDVLAAAFLLALYLDGDQDILTEEEARGLAVQVKSAGHPLATAWCDAIGSGTEAVLEVWDITRQESGAVSELSFPLSGGHIPRGESLPTEIPAELFKAYLSRVSVVHMVGLAGPALVSGDVSGVWRATLGSVQVDLFYSAMMADGAAAIGGAVSDACVFAFAGESGLQFFSQLVDGSHFAVIALSDFDPPAGLLLSSGAASVPASAGDLVILGAESDSNSLASSGLGAILPSKSSISWTWVSRIRSKETIN